MRQFPFERALMIRQLGGQGLPSDQIAFMMRTDEATVREILAKEGTLTAEQAEAEATAAGFGPPSASGDER